MSEEVALLVKAGGLALVRILLDLSSGKGKSL